MIIFFYYVFCGGDKIVNLVMEVIVELGIKNFMFVLSLLIFCYLFLIEYIKNGVVSKIYILGICGVLVDSIFNGLFDEFVYIYLYGGCVYLI